jgi:hypothetical protein
MTATELLSERDHHDRAVAIGRIQRQAERSMEPERKLPEREGMTYER